MTAPVPKFTAFPDEAHQDLLDRAYAADARIVATSLSAQDAMMLIYGLASVAQTLGAAIPAAEQTHADILSKIAAEVTRATQAEAALSQRISALEDRTLVGTTGQLTKALTVGVGGSTTTFGITYAKPMPSADHLVFVTLDNASASLLGTTSVVLPITNRTAFGCTVTVRNTALLTVASSVTVQVAALQLA